MWAKLQRFVRFLATRPSPPETPSALTAAHVQAYRRDRLRTAAARTAGPELAELRRLTRLFPRHSRISDSAAEVLAQRVLGAAHVSRSGYSDAELARLITAARADVAAIERRLTAGERLVNAWRSAPDSLTATEGVLGAQLAGIDETAVVPTATDGVPVRQAQRQELAAQLFVTRADLVPLLVLMVAVSGRNGETVKELPTAHRIVGDRAVELQVTKRRRGARGWHDTVTWEIGPPHRRLHSPGGLYLLLHRLMRRSRAVTGASSVWSVWRNAARSADRGRPAEHRDPFARSLNQPLGTAAWAARHDLRADVGTDQEARARLSVSLPRLRTSVEVRRTRAVGGHLPSAARSNTIPVLFANYLRGDATTRDWAETVLSDAVADAEAAALTAHQTALHAGGVVSLTVNQPGTSAVDQNAWSGCRDPQHRPTTGRACQPLSFLDCFHCGNCVITEAHLPALAGLMTAFSRRRSELSEQDWWSRYGPAWAAIQHEVYPKFTPAQLEHARQAAPPDALLDLVEAPWERP
ncbi:hypothetical protein [Amycolatopsis sp. NPDC059021]|uniref:hypothetical protein n=1 Tax=Amycolatopsis sp. NPDC059021 TaxID=3346704 RepID=UPI003671297C